MSPDVFSGGGGGCRGISGGWREEGTTLLGGLALCMMSSKNKRRKKIPLRSRSGHQTFVCTALALMVGGVVCEWGGQEEVTTPTRGGSLSLCHLLSHSVRLPDEADGRRDLTNANVSTALTHHALGSE